MLVEEMPTQASKRMRGYYSTSETLIYERRNIRGTSFSIQLVGIDSAREFTDLIDDHVLQPAISSEISTHFCKKFRRGYFIRAKGAELSPTCTVTPV
jgi:hypothetical protein